ncbi:MAG: TlpA family protein disulfide reductase [Candidatus Eremiobacteraeota bacterium]|nr:TlpA family protein disulfide reductase [Candidatus Eremiobacteraeota bacterium]
MRWNKAEGKPPRRWWSTDTIWNALAVVAIALVLWKVFVAPRNLDARNAHPAPHAVYPLLDGGTFAVTQARGHVLFLDFFATWCEPCKAELPAVESWARSHPGAIVVPVDEGEPAALARPFALKFGLHGVALDREGNAQALFAVQGYPTVVVIDPAGRVRATWQGLNPAIGLAMTNAAATLAP